MGLVGCLLVVAVGVTFVYAQQGQDYFFNGAGQHPRYLAYQQPSLQTQQQLSNFFTPQTNGAFDPFRTSGQNSQRNEFQPIQPAQFQFPPSRSSSLQHFEQFTSRPTQFVHTNQHLPQPFQHFDSSQDTSSSQNFPFSGVSIGHSSRFQNLPNIQKPTYQSQFENAFIGIQNSEDETGRTTQSYVNVQHPKGFDQFPNNRWKQVQSSISAPPLSESRKPKRPEITRTNTEVQEDDLALNTFVDQNLDNDEGLPRTAASSSPIDIFTKFQDKKREEQNSRRKLSNKVEPISTENPLKFRKNPEFPRGTPAIPKTTGKPEVGTESPFRITTLRSKYNNIRIKPTTYTPPSPSSSPDRRHKNRTGVTYNDRFRFNQPTNIRLSSTSTENPEEIINIRGYSSEFGRPVDKKKTFQNGSPLPRIPLKPFSGPEISRFNAKDQGDRLNLDHEETHKFPEDEEGVDYEYSSDIEEEVPSDPSEAYGELEETPVLNQQPESKISSQEASKIPDKIVNGERNSSFDVLTMSHDHVLVSDENFRDFVDSGSIDVSEQPQTEQPNDEQSGTAVTVKPLSIVNKTISSIRSPKKEHGSNDSPKPTDRPLTSHRDQVKAPPSADEPKAGEEEEEHPTESWVIVASVQTSRSVSGARFLPGSITQQESPKPLGSKSTVSKESNLNAKEKENDTSTVTSQSSDDTLKISSNSTNINSQNKTISQSEIKLNETVAQVITHSVPSTESIIDKLDRVQSELSSGILSGGFRPLEVLPEMSSENSTLSSSSTSTTSTTTPTTTTTTTTTTTPEPTTGGSPPVVIRKFNPSNRRTTARPKPSIKPGVTKKPSIIDSIQFDDLTGLLPPGFKVRNSFTPKKGLTTTTESSAEMQGDEPVKNNSSRTGVGRSNDSSGLPNKIKVGDISGLLPPDYKASSEITPKKPKGIESILSKVTFQDVSALLPPGFKPNKTSEVVEEKPKAPKVPKINFDLPSNLLPPGYKPKEDVKKTKPEEIDISALLPPGFKLTTEEPKEATTSVLDSILNKVKFKDVSSLLPPGFQSNNTNSNSSSTTPAGDEATTPSNGLKVVFPSRPGGGRKPPARANSSSKSAGGIGPLQPKIQKGWPTRATTEFTGWPTVSTTPISIEKILAAAKAANVENFTPSSSTSTTSTTTTTTTTTPAPTTPGVCSHDCDLAATIKLVGGASWVPELLDHNTQEWQTLANEVRDQLESVYSSSEALSRWYKKITIDAFSEGSVLVDYFVELTDLGRTVSTADMRRLFHEALQQATVAQEALSGGDTLKAHNTSEFKMGKFSVDPKYTDFVVLPKQVMPTVGLAEEDVLLPQWAIAVIVIGLASLLFVIIFGVTVLVNRHNSAKKKQPVALTEDMLNELNKNHMGGLDNYGADDLYNMEDVWNDKPTKKRSSGSLQENSMANLYDSWRSEWNGYYYNAAASGYYGGSSSGGYGPGRRRSDYDTNF